MRDLKRPPHNDSWTFQPRSSLTHCTIVWFSGCTVGNKKGPQPNRTWGGSLKPRNYRPSQDLLHERRRLSHYQRLNIPKTRPAAFTPYHMESVTGHCLHNQTEQQLLPQSCEITKYSVYTDTHIHIHNPYGLPTSHIASAHKVTLLMGLRAHILFHFLLYNFVSTF